MNKLIEAKDNIFLKLSELKMDLHTFKETVGNGQIINERFQKQNNKNINNIYQELQMNKMKLEP